MPLLHGSQGCSTYIRRYVISHFKEPMDVASSNFSETSAVFGGGENLRTAITNIVAQYRPTLIGVATTCLSETIGDDVPMFLRQFAATPQGKRGPRLVHVSTPSYSGTHMDGFHAAVQAVARTLAEGGTRGEHVNVFPGFVSTADLRYLKEMLRDLNLPRVLLPDYSETLDGPAWEDYHALPRGGTSVEELTRMGQAKLSIQLGRTVSDGASAARLLQTRFGVRAVRLGMPVGLRETDALWDVLCEAAGRPMPHEHAQERGRLIDACMDGHKYVFGKRVLVCGDEDLVVGLASLLVEVGMLPVLCVSGGRSGKMASAIREVAGKQADSITVCDGVDYASIGEMAGRMDLDLILGNSKAYPIAKQLNIPLVRVGFPVHDRFGGQRLLHLGYRGAQELFDRIVNAIQAQKQEGSDVGYAYL